MPEILNVRFSCGNSNIRDLLQILATKIQTLLQQLAVTEYPQIMLKSEKTCRQNRLKNTGCKQGKGMKGVSRLSKLLFSRPLWGWDNKSHTLGRFHAPPPFFDATNMGYHGLAGHSGAIRIISDPCDTWNLCSTRWISEIGGNA
jgi:hypothetical protein